MLAALLLAACLAPAAPEWVEISQQHYRKPVRTHAHPSADGDPERPTFYPNVEEETRHDFEGVRRAPVNPTKDPARLTPSYGDDTIRRVHSKGDRNVYSNHSITEHTWNHNKYRIPGNFQHVDPDILKIKANVTPQFTLEIYEPETDDPEVVTKSRLKDQERFSATIERVSNKGNVKRVQLSNTPVKSPSVTNTSPNRRNDIRPYGSPPMDSSFSDEFDIKPDIFKNAQEVFPVSPFSDTGHVYSSTKVTPIRNYDIIMTSTVWPTSEPSKGIHNNQYTKHNQKSDNQIVMNKNISTDGNRDLDGNNVQIKPSENININKDRFKEKIHNIVLKNDKDNETEKDENVDFQEVKNSSAVKNNVNQSNKPRDKTTQFPKVQDTSHNTDTSSNASEKKRNEDIKVNTMGNVMKFLKVIADTISRNTRRGVNGKVKYLNELKETLLGSIKDRIDATWPDDDASSASRRRSRSATATARGHVEFPSSESALMTISFLTFAVFLIKLVLQVIQTYKNKAMMVAPLVVATAGRTVKKLRSFH